MDNRAKRKGNSVAEIFIVLAIVVVVNLLGYKLLRYRVDFTENQMYTVSQATREFFASLDAPLTIDFYMTSDLPPQLASMRTEVKDRLGEFESMARGNLVIRYIDPLLADVVPFLILIATLVIRPWGLFGTKEELDRV